MESDMSLRENLLGLDPAVETERLTAFLKETVQKIMRRQGAVVGISGGIDSSVVLGLCVKAFGPERVIALMMPEKDSDPETEKYSRMIASHFGVEPVLENISPVLEGFGCYQRRDEAVRRLFPEYDAGANYKVKIVLPQNLLDEDTLNFFSITILTPDGEELTRRLPLKEYFQIVAASNFKQRTRMSMLYYHAELHNYAVIGTANKNEHGQGFFVKYGDGGVDVQPVVHLFKTQIYQLAEYLEVPAEIRQRTPTTDTYSAPTTQEEFFFRLPFETMDLLWAAQEQGTPIAEVAIEMNLSEVQIQRAYKDFQRKQRTTEYLRMPVVALQKTS
jgi:NAD+ synthase